MILKASKRGGARQLERHLMNEEKNEHVTVHEVSGFASDNIRDALDEIYVISKGTRCSHFPLILLIMKMFQQKYMRMLYLALRKN